MLLSGEPQHLDFGILESGGAGNLLHLFCSMTRTEALGSVPGKKLWLLLDKCLKLFE